jgi:hypothetical protein
MRRRLHSYAASRLKTGMGRALRPRGGGCRRNEIFGGYDLPFAVSLDPGVGPDELSGGAALLLPALIALSYGCVPVEADFNFVKMVGSEFGRVGAEILDGVRFGIVAAIDIDSHEVIREDAFENAHVVGDDRLGPVRLGSFSQKTGPGPAFLILLAKVACPCLSGFWRDTAGILVLRRLKCPSLAKNAKGWAAQSCLAGASGQAGFSTPQDHLHSRTIPLRSK